MSFFNRYDKSWILISLFSLLVWVLYWLPSSIERFYNVIFISVDYYSLGRFWIYMPAGIGMVARFVGVVIGLFCLIMIWKGSKSFFEAKKWVALALVMEGVYYASLFPSAVWLNTGLFGAFDFGFTALGISYLLQVLFTVPFLFILAFKITKYQASGFAGWKWVGFAFVGYICALWSNSVLRWFDMIIDDGLAVLFSIVGVGAFNAFIFMSLAVIFAMACAAYLIKKDFKSGIRWLALSLTMVGLHYIIYIIYSYYVGALSSVWLIDIWTISLLGLGLTLLLKRNNTA